MFEISYVPSVWERRSAFNNEWPTSEGVDYHTNLDILMQDPLKGFFHSFFFSFSSAFFQQDMPFLFAPLTVPHIPLPAPITESWGLGIGLEPRPCL